MHRICTKYAKNICSNMQIYAIYMQKYALPTLLSKMVIIFTPEVTNLVIILTPEVTTYMQKYAQNMHLYAQICTKYAFICVNM
jgi:hypothetical protein